MQVVVGPLICRETPETDESAGLAVVEAAAGVGDALVRLITARTSAPDLWRCSRARWHQSLVPPLDGRATVQPPPAIPLLISGISRHLVLRAERLAGFAGDGRQRDIGQDNHYD